MGRYVLCSAGGEARREGFVFIWDVERVIWHFALDGTEYLYTIPHISIQGWEDRGTWNAIGAGGDGETSCAISPRERSFL